MAKREFQLTQKQENELIQAYGNCKDGPTRTRYQAVRLYGIGYPVEEIMKITGCSRPSLMEWCRSYREYGVAGLIDKRRGGNRAKLTASQIEELQCLLHTYTPVQLLGVEKAMSRTQYWTVEDVQELVSQRYGVAYKSRASCYRLFRLCGFSYQKTEKVFKSRSELKVAEFECLVEKN